MENLKNFRSLLNAHSSFHGHNTRNKDMLRKPKGRLKKFSNSFLTCGIDIWNNLHESIKNCLTLKSFKSRLKGYMLNNK